MSLGSKQKRITADEMELLAQTQVANPILYDRVMGLLDMVHDSRRRTADDVEFQVIDNLRDLGKDLLTTWATKQAEIATTKAIEEDSELKRSKKKR